MKKVCFLVSYNQYETKRYFTEKFSEAFIRSGIECRIYDVVETKIHENILESIQEFEPDFTLSFNSFLPFEDNNYLWDLLKIPHLTMLLEPSLYSVNLINSPFSIISSVDHFDCYGLSTQNFDRLFFMPHAVDRESCLVNEETAKIYDIVFIGSCYHPEKLKEKWEKEVSNEESKIILKATELLLNNKEIPLQEALILSWKESKVPLEEIDFLKLFSYIDKYSKGLDRINLIKNIKNESVHIFGSSFEDDPSSIKGWEDLLTGQKNVTFHKEVSYAEGLNILQKSKISLNSSPFFKNGSHERIFSGFAAGSLVITNRTLFTDQEFNDDSIVYDPNHYEEIESKIKFYLTNELKRKEAVSKYRQKILKNHTWDLRVSLVKEVIPYLILKTKPFIKL